MGKSSMRRAIGLMSGTSVDGIDVALIATDGESHVERFGFESFAYDDTMRVRLSEALNDAAEVTDRDARPGCLSRVEHELTVRHADAVAHFLQGTKYGADDIDLIAFHGQTVLHRPEQRLTMQLGNGADLAKSTGIDVVYDLRAEDVAAGGQGAPLAPAYHRVMAAMMSKQAGQGPTAILNIGGVANVTFVSANGDLTAFDTGPGNALIDDWVYARTGSRFDEDGELARAGTVDPAVLNALLANPYFAAPAPKSLDRNHFDAGTLAALGLEDGAATLMGFTAGSIALALQHTPEAPKSWIVCGGGRLNRALMAELAKQLPGDVLSAEDAGFNGDAIEAEAWAYLGVRSQNGAAITFPGTTGVPVEMTGGKIAHA